MSDPFIGQIIYFAGSFAPQNYAFCNGQLLSIQQNSALYSILGTTYGGDGQTTFALPDLRGRVPIHSGGGSQGPGVSAYQLGQRAGTETVSLNIAQLPAHNHIATGTLNASTAKGTAATPAAGLVLSRGVDGDADPNAVPFIYGPAPTSGAVALGGVTVTTNVAGANAPVPNIQPYLGLNAIIALNGIYPSRN